MYNRDMDITDYSKQALTTLVDDHAFGNMNPALVSQVYGLVGESGEVAEKFKKIIRDKQGNLTDEDTKEILKELGDVLWYVNSISHLLGSDLASVAQQNLDKVLSRKQRGVTSGSGDNR